MSEAFQQQQAKLRSRLAIVANIRWSSELNRVVLVNCDGQEIDVGFGHDEPPFIPTYEWRYKSV